MAKKWSKSVNELKYHYMLGNFSLCGEIRDGVESELINCENIEEDYICKKCLKKFEQILDDFVETGWTA